MTVLQILPILVPIIAMTWISGNFLGTMFLLAFANPDLSREHIRESFFTNTQVVNSKVVPAMCISTVLYIVLNALFVHSLPIWLWMFYLFPSFYAGLYVIYVVDYFIQTAKGNTGA